MKQSKLPPGSTVWIVARHSPGKGQSMDTQLSVLREHCKANQLIIKDEFIDAGVSGKKVTRKEFTRMQKLAEGSDKNLVDGVIFYDNSRLARNLKLARYVKSMLIFKGYQLERLIGQDIGGIAGVVVDDLEDYHNEEYLEIIRQKSKDGLRQRFQLRDEAGNYIGFWAGAIPWGYKRVDKVLPVIDTITGKHKVRQCIEPDYPLWSLGQELFTLRATGLTCKEIEQRTGFFGQRGTVNIYDAFVLTSSYQHFFRNPIYKGKLVFQELTIENYVPAMVSPELWEAANSASITYKRGYWTSRGQVKVSKANPEFLLAGLCECEICQGPFYTTSVVSGSRDRWLRYYVCRTKKTVGGKACLTRYIPAAIYEPRVIDHASDNYFDFIELIIEEMTSLMSNNPPPFREIEQIKDEINEVDKSIRRLIELAEKTEGVEEVWQRITKLKTQKRTAESRLEYLRNQLAFPRMMVTPEELRKTANDYREHLRDDPRITLKQIVDRILINPNKSTIFYKMPFGVVDTILPESFYSYQVGYAIELPC